MLRQLRQIRHSVLPATLQTLIVTLVLSRLEYGNAVLVGLPAYPIGRLQSVMNASGLDVSSYRTISNLPVLSKLVECLVVRQLVDYLQSANLLPVNQSGF